MEVSFKAKIFMGAGSKVFIWEMRGGGSHKSQQFRLLVVERPCFCLWGGAK